MARHIKPRFKNHTFVDGSFIAVKDLIGVDYVNAIEIRNTNGVLFVRSTADVSQVEDYEQNEIFKLNQETIRPGIKGFDISELEISGNTGEQIKIEFHI